jgi:Uma2 family endonuclease
MNELFIPPQERPTTQAADGLPRWRWTVAEVERLAAAGFFHEDERIELLGGEIVPMSPKGNRHEILREEISFKFAQSAPRGVFVACEPQFNLTQDTYMVPDILVRPAAIKTPKLRASEALLVVEVADTSLEYDLRTKVPLCATHGVREYWVINALTLMTIVHQKPSGNGFAFTEEVAPDVQLVPSLAPALAVSLSALDLD